MAALTAASTRAPVVSTKVAAVLEAATGKRVIRIESTANGEKPIHKTTVCTPSGKLVTPEIRVDRAAVESAVTKGFLETSKLTTGGIREYKITDAGKKARKALQPR